jgi:peroxiredoxin
MFLIFLFSYFSYFSCFPSTSCSPCAKGAAAFPNHLAQAKNYQLLGVSQKPLWRQPTKNHFGISQ